jgi:pimeloyl-ACP methyl ester carboxylesterase
MVTEDFAAHYPQDHQSPAGIVLVDGGTVQLNDEPGMTWEKARDRLTPPKLGGTPQDEFIKRLSGWIKPWDPSGLALPIFLANFEVDSEERIWPRLTFERHIQIVRAIWEFQAYDLLQSIRCPALAVLSIPPEPASEGDLEFLARKRKGVQHTMSVLPELQVEWMQDTIHDIPVQRPGILAQLMLNFFNQLA